jgi:hypothetical protein
MLLKIVSVFYNEVDETDKSAWNPEDGTPAQITQGQLNDYEIEVSELIQSIDDQEEPFNMPTYYVTEVVDVEAEKDKILNLQDLR